MSRRYRSEILFVLLGYVLVAGTVLAPSGAWCTQPAGGLKTFATPEKAVEVFIEALKADDQIVLSALFGPESVSNLSSGDAVRDRADRELFLNAYGTANSLKKIGSDRAILHVGNEEWPFPIPIVRKGKVWAFDSREGRKELRNRRIGRNELRVIETMEAYVTAQREYAGKDRRGEGIFAYAPKIVSSPGKKDGLYWPAKEGEEESPLGPLAALAAQEGYTGTSTAPVPFQGYYFKVLSAQGDSAPGGAYDYVVKGNMILGFGLLAYPAKYGASGIMTFIVNQQGVVYQKDLGKRTTELAAAIRNYDPDRTWRKIRSMAGGDVAESPGKSF